MKGIIPAMVQIGLKIDARPAEDLRSLAPAVEAAGFEELWVCEDLGLAGGIAQSATALALTERIGVGLGIAPAAVRNPMYLAMELGALARLGGGRFHAGIGHGMPGWLSQVGAHPGSLMTGLREVTAAVQALLDGDAVTVNGRHVQMENVRLTDPPSAPTPLSLGVRGPRGIAAARDLQTGVILAEGSTPEYVADVRSVLGPAAWITVFVWANIDPDDEDRGRAALASTVGDALNKDYLAAQLGDLLGATTVPEATERLTVSGDAAGCRAGLVRFADAGADAIILQPVHGREEEQIELFGRQLISSF